MATKIFTPARLAEFQAFEASPEGQAALATPSAIGGRVLRRLIAFATNIVIARAKKNDPNFDEEAARAEIDAAVKAIGDGQIWDWLINGGFEKLLEWIMLIIGMFG